MSVSDETTAALRSRTGDQRKYERFAVSFPVTFWGEQSDGVGTAVDISREGCRIVSGDIVPRGDYLHMQISVDGRKEPMRIDLAVARWSRKGEFGVEFIRMNPSIQAQWRNTIRSCEIAGSSRESRTEVQSHSPSLGFGEQSEGRA